MPILPSPTCRLHLAPVQLEMQVASEEVPQERKEPLVGAGNIQLLIWHFCHTIPVGCQPGHLVIAILPSPAGRWWRCSTSTCREPSRLSTADSRWGWMRVGTLGLIFATFRMSGLAHADPVPARLPPPPRHCSHPHSPTKSAGAGQQPAGPGGAAVPPRCPGP